MRACGGNCTDDCELSPWTAWGACGATCGGGHRIRWRGIVASGARGCAAALSGWGCLATVVCPVHPHIGALSIVLVRTILMDLLTFFLFFLFLLCAFTTAVAAASGGGSTERGWSVGWDTVVAPARNV